MSFWEKALGAPAAPPQQATVMQPSPPLPGQHSQPWFIPQTPQQVQPQVPQPVQYPQQPQPQEQAPLKAMSARSTMSCPDCGSGNIFKPNGHPNAMEQCYHCGWNPRFSHSTAGAGMPSDATAPARPSKQVSTANNFNPQTIVATVS